MAGRPCTVCQHPEAHPINISLVQGESNRSIARSYGFSENAVRRHRKGHLPKLVVKAKDAVEEGHALDVVKQLKAINSASLSILKEARDGDEPGLALRAIDRITRQIELQAKLLGELDKRPQINIYNSAEWQRIEVAVANVVHEVPDAGEPFARHLLALRSSDDNGRF